MDITVHTFFCDPDDYPEPRDALAEIADDDESGTWSGIRTLRSVTVDSPDLPFDRAHTVATHEAASLPFPREAVVVRFDEGLIFSVAD